MSEDGTPRELPGVYDVGDAGAAGAPGICQLFFFRNGQFCSVDSTSSLEAWNWGALLGVVVDRLNFWKLSQCSSSSAANIRDLNNT